AVSSASTTTVGLADTGLTPGSTHTYAVTASDGTNTSDPPAQSGPVTVASGPTTYFSDSFTGGLAGWSPVTNVTLDQTQAPPTGAVPSVRAAPAGQSAYMEHTLPSSQVRVCLSAQVRVGTLPSTGSLALLKLRTAGKVSAGRVEPAPPVPGFPGAAVGATVPGGLPPPVGGTRSRGTTATRTTGVPCRVENDQAGTSSAPCWSQPRASARRAPVTTTGARE